MSVTRHQSVWGVRGDQNLFISPGVASFLQSPNATCKWVWSSQLRFIQKWFIIKHNSRDNKPTAETNLKSH